MAPAPAPSISFCVIDGEPVFLDVRRDRYFRLNAGTRHAFLRLLNRDATATAADRQTLLAAGILPDSKVPLSPCAVAVPDCDLIDIDASGATATVVAVIEVALLLLPVCYALRRGRLAALVERHEARVDDEANPRTQDEIATLIRRFQAARRFVPIAPGCLIDSLALSGFLWKRSIRPTLVFGVRLHPFGAHCWLQTRKAILNDSIENVRTFTPIRIV